MSFWEKFQDTAFDYIDEGLEKGRDSVFDHAREYVEEKTGAVAGGSSGSSEPFSPTGIESLNTPVASGGNTRDATDLPVEGEKRTMGIQINKWAIGGAVILAALLAKKKGLI